MLLSYSRYLISPCFNKCYPAHTSGRLLNPRDIEKPSSCQSSTTVAGEMGGRCFITYNRISVGRADRMEQQSGTSPSLTPTIPMGTTQLWGAFNSHDITGVCLLSSLTFDVKATGGIRTLSLFLRDLVPPNFEQVQESKLEHWFANFDTRFRYFGTTAEEWPKSRTVMGRGVMRCYGWV